MAQRASACIDDDRKEWAFLRHDSLDFVSNSRINSGNPILEAGQNRHLTGLRQEGQQDKQQMAFALAVGANQHRGSFSAKMENFVRIFSKDLNGRTGRDVAVNLFLDMKIQQQIDRLLEPIINFYKVLKFHSIIFFRSVSSLRQ